MKNKKLVAGMAILTVLVISTGFISSASAYQGDPNTKGPNYSPEKYEAMTKAFEAKDYNAWLKAKGDQANGKIMNVINKDNFSKFAEMRELMIKGDVDGANAIKAELGLGQGKMNHNGKRHGGRCGKNANNSQTGGQNQNENNSGDDGDEINDSI